MMPGEFQAAVWSGLFISKGLNVPQTNVTKLIFDYIADNNLTD